MYSGTETAWTQPTLTSNGTLGGNRFAVSASNNYDASTYPIYKSFDNDDSTIWYCSSAPVDVIMYNPQPLKITKIQCKNRVDAANYTFTAGTVYGSNDGSSWTQLTTFTNNVTTAGGTYDISLSSNTNFYIYYKVTFSTASTTGVGANFTITATYLDIPSMFTTEANWQTSVTNYGVCGKFVYDSVNNTVRLPKITGFTEGTIDPTVLGDLVEAGLPNIESGFALQYPNDGYKHNITYRETADKRGSAVPSFGNVSQIEIDASLSNSIYGNSTTVQPQSIKVLYYIVIATTTKTDIQVDIDEVMTDLNGKVSTADLATCHVVVETYVNGTSWYRVYDDGWCEQGGHIEESSINVVNISFLKAYISIPTLLTSVNSTARTSYLDNGIDIFNLTTTGFTKQYTVNVGTGWAWQACGYIRQEKTNGNYSRIKKALYRQTKS